MAMEIGFLRCSTSPLCSSSQSLPAPIRFRRCRIARRRRQDFTFRVRCSSSPDWQRLSLSIQKGSQKFWSKCRESLKKEAGLDPAEASAKAREVAGRVAEQVKVGEAELTRLRTGLFPAFLQWNHWGRWKDVENWDPRRVGALILYVFVVVFSCRRMYIAVRAPFLDSERKEVTEAYMEALIPEPSPSNVRKFKKGMWRKSTPKGLKLKKFIEGPDGTLVHDPSYVGEDAWDDNEESLQRNLKQIIDSDIILKEEQKSKVRGELAIQEEVKESSNTWRERLNTWKGDSQK